MYIDFFDTCSYVYIVCKGFLIGWDETKGDVLLPFGPLFKIFSCVVFHTVTN